MKSYLRRTKASKSTLRLIEAIVEGRDRRRTTRRAQWVRGFKGGVAELISDAGGAK
jgi:hypothetical protein